MIARRHGVVLASETSIQIGGMAPAFYVPGTTAELRRLLEALHKESPFILGGGCNTLFPDGRFERPVISTECLRRLEVGETTIRAECGVRIDSLIRSAVECGLGGLECLVGIPGTVGGATVMNAGGQAGSFGDAVECLGLLRQDGSELVEVPGSEVPWGYRSWNVEGYVVAWVLLKLAPMSTAELRKRARDLFMKKHRNQPLAEPSSGCIFRNPPGGSAGSLIDSLGLKGLERGGARVSERHANFIVNPKGHASAADVLGLMRDIHARVEDAYQVKLEPEIVVASPGEPGLAGVENYARSPESPSDEGAASKTSR